MKPPAGILVVVATYNEIENLPDLTAAILEHAPDAHVLVIDDNSPDGTGRWCDERAATEKRLACLHRPSKQGLGTAAVAGFRYAIEFGYEFVVTMDADFSHDPRLIPEIRRRMTGGDQDAVDVVIGSRYVAGGAIEGWPWHRRLMSRAINFYTRKLLRLNVADCSGAFRCYRTASLQQLELDQISARGYAYVEEILWRLAKRGARFAEVPITYVNRKRGATKINWLEAVSALLIILRLSLTGTRQRDS
jgi:dolichol-phosphate mannosyltransferase